MVRPKLLDLYCCGGGASRGYDLAGFTPTGVDIKEQCRYPYMFVRMSALDFLDGFGRDFQAVHASPPCQDHSKMGAMWPDNGTAWLLEATRDALRSFDGPWVIENVEGADLKNPVTLCGSMFGLQVRRHRLFEASFTISQPECDHDGQGPVFHVNGHTGGTSTRDGLVGRGSLAQWKAAMGIDWMSMREISQAIPPAYAEHVGRAMMEVLR